MAKYKRKKVEIPYKEYMIRFPKQAALDIWCHVDDGKSADDLINDGTKVVDACFYEAQTEKIAMSKHKFKMSLQYLCVILMFIFTAAGGFAVLAEPGEMGIWGMILFACGGVFVIMKFIENVPKKIKKEADRLCKLWFKTIGAKYVEGE